MKASGRNNPCPVCSRVKDADCRWNDTIKGNKVDDVIIGGKGVDTIYTGKGNDMIYMSKKLGKGGKSYDLIMDFTKGKDYLLIEDKKGISMSS